MLQKLAAVFFSAVLLAACSASNNEYSGSNGKTLIISKQVWGWYKEYLDNINSVNKGIFVVGIHNGVAVVASSWYCPGDSCMTANSGKIAFDNCRKFGAELECIRFARSSDILVKYKVEGE